LAQAFTQGRLPEGVVNHVQENTYRKDINL